ncbi:MAG TPA: ABC transporter substrate-binding protein, partial [Tepidisphaeraceae bacterium]|nr:ABC transporter substrate-binding protein [Tepidisphaeraceae bacterium]
MTRRLILSLLLVVAVLSAGVAAFVTSQRHDIAPSRSGPVAGAAEPTVASITPAGTDLIIGIGAAGHLVAVSDLDEDRDGVRGLPRVGDFDHVDWEKLAAAEPKILITQFGHRMPAGLKERCDQMGIQLIDIQLNVIEDVYRQADVLGMALGMQAVADERIEELRQKLAEV